MGVFDAMTSVVLEAGRMERPVRRPAEQDAGTRRAWRLRLSHMPTLAVALLALVVR